MGVNGSQTVFDGGLDCGYLQAAWARFRQADGTYRQQVLTAFQEVEDALNNIEYQGKQYASLDIAWQEASKRVTLSQTRFEKGLINILDVLNNQEAALSAQINVSNALGARYLSTIQLIKALGGQWQPLLQKPSAEEPY
jgi:multidrug efflux system outer membrane protein